MTSQPPARRRNIALVVLDIAAGILLLFVGVAVALTVITQALAYRGLHAQCGAGPFDGIECNGAVLNIVVYGLIAVAVLALFLGFGMFIVNLIRKRVAFYWPLAGVVVSLVLFYVGTWVAGLTVP
jgi:uncharacterized BrkB/YihY/UPF0761 family membrane protein